MKNIYVIQAYPKTEPDQVWIVSYTENKNQAKEAVANYSLNKRYFYWYEEVEREEY